MILADAKLRISDEAFSYLIHQRGALWDLREDRAAWEAAYHTDLGRTYHAMAPHLLKMPIDSERPSVLDIGSGMGGINLMIHEHYGYRGQFALVDRYDGQAEMASHDTPFGSLTAARRFLLDNGFVPGSIDCLPAESATGVGLKFDVIISTQAWCFHFEPQAYLDWALSAARPKATFIVDVRRNRPAWLADLIAKLGKPTTAASGPKSDLLVFRAP